MRKNLAHTFLTVFLILLVFIIILLCATSEPGGTVLLLGLFFSCAPFPTYLAVLVYHFITKKIFPNNKVYAVLFSPLILLFIYHLCLVLYFAITFSKPWPGFMDNMIHEYTEEYTVLNISAVLLAIFIPLADILIEKIKLDLKR